MSRPVLACLRCGDEGPDVVMRLADLEDEAKEDGERLGTVTVAMPVGESRTGVRGMEYSEVPARYGREPRCRDRDACRMRAAQQRDHVATFAEPAEEVPPWA